ncbi:MAG: site-2 protease family protein [bacterium]
MDYLQLAIIGLPILFFSLTVHEFAHAWTANRMGDPTAKQMGRMSLNPLVHLDLMGLLVMVGSGFRFGWAKPVPINPFNFRDWRKGTFLVSAAGPASNIILAVAAAAVFHLVSFLGLDPQSQSIAHQFLYFMILVNCALAFFNMIPLPPLDGSKILFSLLPPRYENFAISLERYGPMLLIAVIFIGFMMPGGRSIIWMVIGPFVDLMLTILIGK